MPILIITFVSDSLEMDIIIVNKPFLLQDETGNLLLIGQILEYCE